MRDSSSQSDNGRRVWRRGDWILILTLLACAAAVALLYNWRSAKGSSPVCTILLDREVVMTVDLSRDQTFSVDGLPQVVFEVKGGKIAFLSSDCPDQICVHTGFIGQPGQSAACLPNHVALRIEGADGPDAVV